MSVSKYTGWREIVIKASDVMIPPMEPIVATGRKDIKMGFLGMGEKQGSDFTVQLEKNVFTFGEQVSVNVISDNT